MSRVALIGNPNSGKTTVFNVLTGAHQRVGNWPGVTVERKSGHVRHGDDEVELVDLPGIYSLLATDAGDAIDEQIARNYLLGTQLDAIINVVDATSLARGLFLTSQLLDLDVPVILALNMMDVADRHGMHIDPYRLSETLGCPVVPLVASRAEGIGTLKDVLTSRAGSEAEGILRLSETLETALAERAGEIRNSGISDNLRFHAVASLDGESGALSVARYHAIDAALSGALETTPVRRTVTDVVDSVVLNRWLAFPFSCSSCT